MREENKKGREEKIREIKEICGEEKKKEKLRADTGQLEKKWKNV